jgi:N utilization substance protein A
MVREVLVDDEGKSATVVVPDDQLSLAIGKEGQNARLANKLTGWRIDIKSESQMVEEEESLDYDEEEEDVSGRCCALTGSGKRCPNAALPDSKYCGIPSHQKQAEEETEADVQEVDDAVAEAAEAEDAVSEAAGDEVEAEVEETEDAEATAATDQGQ